MNNNIKWLRGLLSSVSLSTALLGLLVAPAAVAAKNDALTQFLRWHSGDFSNYQQRAAQPAGAQQALVRHHYQMLDDSLNHRQMQGQLLLAEMYLSNADEALYRRQLYQFSQNSRGAIVQRVYTLPSTDEWQIQQAQPLAGCDVVWHWQAQAQAYTGERDGQRCQFVDSNSGDAIHLSSQLRLSRWSLSNQELAQRDDGNYVLGSADSEPLLLERIQRFSMRVQYRIVGRDGESRWAPLAEPLTITDQGQLLTFSDTEAAASLPYRVSLLRQASNAHEQPQLRLTLWSSADDSITVSADRAATQLGVATPQLRLQLQLSEAR
ncbi:CpcT/CpeT family chromophore lyase [Idiomarina xiamenensis]|uniref:Uncharacterized protein n=1 Tax=Idiomarina xiamenensis 10-D-4 TaxID=740709 RepID=K2KN28_9GAMM|nr:CpcT/CpeT family chromophore lyase [Idiomarina xiamenensis]EKE83869.1 hypothetical protein A10D4_06976 [Idiomarina xiamenensis 10-D-4]